VSPIEDPNYVIEWNYQGCKQNDKRNLPSQGQKMVAGKGDDNNNKAQSDMFESRGNDDSDVK
jgi:hypothetical protein